ncbi:MAG TPA: LPS-assembly protein LptD [Gallionellaceae bacterium]|nr:LPS-assembly protein LptD [Gallionellaceae bacterium]HQS75517.1 LPS-assembly protein LptD [Gallionellaceae bacterium]
MPKNKAGSSSKARPVKSVVASSQEAPTVITADSVEAKQGQILEATGNAVLRKDDQMIRADHLLFLQESNELFADGSVRLEKSDAAVTGPSLKLDLNKSTGEMAQPSFTLTDAKVRGNAETLHIEGKQQFTFDKASYTSCPAGNDDWLLKMSELNLDRNTQIGTAYNARIEFMGVPILYTPWMNFPLNDRRRSGLLGPTLGSTNKGGRELTVPFYWNIASNYDATISPRFIQNRGVLLDNEFRYLGSSYAGKIDYGELQGDKVALRNRSHSTLLHTQDFGAGFSGMVNLNEASDDAYFRDLSSIPSIATQKHLLQEGVVTYGGGGWWNASVRAQSFQTLQDPDAIVPLPYRRLPQVNLGAQRVMGRVNATLNTEFVNFNHPTNVNGSRAVLYPNITYLLVNDPAYYITPKLGMHISQYSLTENNPNPVSVYNRSVPIFSINSGMVLEREFTAYDSEYAQTLEPRIFYVHIPHVDQDALPNFDSAPAVFSFMQMFTENRFVGNDRIGDADQVTMALTSRLLDADNGNEMLRVVIGERFSSQKPRVILGVPTATNNASDVLMSVAGRMSNTLTLDSLMQYNPNESRTEMFAAVASYRPEVGKVLNLGYRYTFSADPDPTKTLKQIDFSAQWPFLGRWHTVTQMQYSLQEARTVQAMAGLEYYQDCWAIRFGAKQFATTLRETSTTVFIQLELNELIRVGDDTLSSMRQSVPGYTKLN